MNNKNVVSQVIFVQEPICIVDTFLFPIRNSEAEEEEKGAESIGKQGLYTRPGRVRGLLHHREHAQICQVHGVQTTSPQRTCPDMPGTWGTDYFITENMPRYARYMGYIATSPQRTCPYMPGTWGTDYFTTENMPRYARYMGYIQLYHREHVQICQVHGVQTTLPQRTCPAICQVHLVQTTLSQRTCPDMPGTWGTLVACPAILHFITVYIHKTTCENFEDDNFFKYF